MKKRLFIFTNAYKSSKDNWVVNSHIGSNWILINLSEYMTESQFQLPFPGLWFTTRKLVLIFKQLSNSFICFHITLDLSIKLFDSTQEIVKISAISVTLIDITLPKWWGRLTRTKSRRLHWVWLFRELTFGHLNHQLFFIQFYRGLMRLDWPTTTLIFSSGVALQRNKNKGLRAQPVRQDCCRK